MNDSPGTAALLKFAENIREERQACLVDHCDVFQAHVKISKAHAIRPSGSEGKLLGRFSIKRPVNVNCDGVVIEPFRYHLDPLSWKIDLSALWLVLSPFMPKLLSVRPEEFVISRVSVSYGCTFFVGISPVADGFVFCSDMFAFSLSVEPA